MIRTEARHPPHIRLVTRLGWAKSHADQFTPLQCLHLIPKLVMQSCQTTASEFHPRPLYNTHLMSSCCYQKSGLLAGPYEIRNLIHKQIFSGEDDYLHISIEKLKHHVCEVSRGHGLLLTCKQIHREAIKIYQAGLVQLVIVSPQIQQNLAIFGLATYSRDAPLPRIFTVLNSLHGSPQRRDSLHRIKLLTIPASVAPGVLWQCLQLGLLPAVVVVELVDKCTYDVCSDSFLNDKKARGTDWYSQNSAYRDLAVAEFNPSKHVAQSRNAGWSQLVNPVAYSKQQWTTKFQMLWTTHARWHFLCSASSFADRVSYGQLSWLGSCRVIDFVSPLVLQRSNDIDTLVHYHIFPRTIFVLK